MYSDVILSHAYDAYDLRFKTQFSDEGSTLFGPCPVILVVCIDKKSPLDSALTQGKKSSDLQSHSCLDSALRGNWP